MDSRNMTVKDLKKILKTLPNDMAVIIPVITTDDANDILAFRFVRTAGILECPDEDPYRVLCINAAADGADIGTQIGIPSRKFDSLVSCVRVLY